MGWIYENNGIFLACKLIYTRSAVWIDFESQEETKRLLEIDTIMLSDTTIVYIREPYAKQNGGVRVAMSSQIRLNKLQSELGKIGVKITDIVYNSTYKFTAQYRVTIVLLLAMRKRTAMKHQGNMRWRSRLY